MRRESDFKPPPSHLPSVHPGLTGNKYYASQSVRELSYKLEFGSAAASLIIGY